MIPQLLFALLLFGVGVQAQPPQDDSTVYGTFVGCATTSFLPSDGVFTGDAFTQAEDWALNCYYNPDGEYMWAYFVCGTGQCLCSNTYYPSNQLAVMLEQYVNTLRCADDDYTGIVSDPEVCLHNCQDYNYASTQLQGDAEGASMNCWCGSQTTYLGANGYEVPCDYNTYVIFQHPVGTVVNSVYAKRQLKERLIRIKNRKRALCPGKMTACKVQGVSDSFECIDTTQELESCGGCSVGEFNVHNTTLGIDCTALPGVPRGAITCSNSKCSAFACKKGWTLATDGTCVRS
ncbi:hypothetical protein L486_03039 [Kwoniella mangroviensis CBS 10435]|uniref:Protein CPL1-like domain-containing protein n=1 Tax=Kwoniella mangroviensis CBS 10435 TaxID=1331196 RepID=A0A1B9IXU3_9TREE|nr:hypothetical protein L486_03039 [Kwoniella mangroviensis CBS 10435]